MISHAPAAYECPFCAYVAGRWDDWVEADHVIERTSETLTFVSPTWWPNNPGNVLVVPTTHYENIYALPDDLGTPLQRAVRRGAMALKNVYGCDGTSTRQHNEPAGNQDVWHFHIHVFPRWHGDDLYGTHSSRVPKAEMARVATQLKDELARLG